MASLSQWIAGARPRTLPNAIAPVIAGTGGAAWLHAAVWWKALLALAVAVALIIGVNFANDYSDGIRGTDDNRAGPLRLVGSRLAAPRSVLTVALASLVVAAAAGLALALTSAPWLIAVGALCIAGAWLYTGGSKPYGYAGFGEVAVFLFFGLVAVLGTQFTQASRVDWVGVALAVATGALSSAVSGGQQLTRYPDRRRVGQNHAGSAVGRQGDTRLLSVAAGRCGRADVGADRGNAVVCPGPAGHPVGDPGREAGANRADWARADPGLARHRSDDAGLVGRGGGSVGLDGLSGLLERTDCAASYGCQAISTRIPRTLGERYDGVNPQRAAPHRAAGPAAVRGRGGDARWLVPGPRWPVGAAGRTATSPAAWQ